MTELLPCPNPWCGSTEIIRISGLTEDGRSEGEYRSCVHCGVSGPVGADEAEANKLWNTRPAPSPADVEAAQVLQDHMEQHHGICLKASDWDAAIAAMSARPDDERAAVVDSTRKALEAAREALAAIVDETKYVENSYAKGANKIARAALSFIEAELKGEG